MILPDVKMTKFLTRDMHIILLRCQETIFSIKDALLLNSKAKGVYHCIRSSYDGAELGELLHVLVMLLLLLGFAGAVVAPHYQINRY